MVYVAICYLSIYCILLTWRGTESKILDSTSTSEKRRASVLGKTAVVSMDHVRLPPIAAGFPLTLRGHRRGRSSCGPIAATDGARAAALAAADSRSHGRRPGRKGRSASIRQCSYLFCPCCQASSATAPFFSVVHYLQKYSN